MNALKLFLMSLIFLAATPAAFANQALCGFAGDDTQYTRYGEKIDHPYYVTNLKAAQDYFRQWLNSEISIEPKTEVIPYSGGATNTISSFQQLYSHLHQLAVGTLENRYWPYDIKNGQKFGPRPEGNVGVPRNRGQINGVLAQTVLLKETVRSDILRSMGWNSFPLVYIGAAPAYRWVAKIDDIPDGGWPKLGTSADGREISCEYPTSGYVNNYLTQMSLVMEKIKTVSNRREHRQEVLELLGKYYQLGVVGHIFARVNNSILMAQINIVLVEMGLKPVSHGDMDYVVRSLDTPNAVAYFVETILKHQ